MLAGCARGDDVRLGLERARVGIVASDLAIDEMGMTLFDSLCVSPCPTPRLNSASDLMTDLRLVKSANEVAALRDAAQLADQVAVALAKRDSARANGTAGRRPRGAGGTTWRGGVRHHYFLGHFADFLSPSDYEFRQGCVVNTEITVQLAGYWVQICRVFSSARLRRAQRRFSRSLTEPILPGVKALYRGAGIRDVSEASNRVIAASGLKNFAEFGPGHGVGLDLPELYGIDHGVPRRNWRPESFWLSIPESGWRARARHLSAGPVAVTTKAETITSIRHNRKLFEV